LGIKTGNLLFTSGAVGWDASEKNVGGGDIKAQTRQAFENIRSVVESAGGSMENIVKVTVYLTDPDDYPAMNEVRAEVFPKDPPASTAFVDKRLIPPDCLVEIEAVAALD
jgi:reactive intermediate/imine deaminase